MQQKKLYAPFRIAGYAVLLLMAAAIAYACTMAIRYWPSIGV